MQISNRRRVAAIAAMAASPTPVISQALLSQAQGEALLIEIRDASKATLPAEPKKVSGLAFAVQCVTSVGAYAGGFVLTCIMIYFLVERLGKYLGGSGGGSAPGGGGGPPGGG
jgi:hypothetical protein